MNCLLYKFMKSSFKHYKSKKFQRFLDFSHSLSLSRCKKLIENKIFRIFINFLLITSVKTFSLNSIYTYKYI